MIVSVGKKYMLLGVTPNSVNKICDIDEEDLAVSGGDTPSESGFMQSLKKAFAEKNQDAGNKSSEKDLRNEKDDF